TSEIYFYHLCVFISENNNLIRNTHMEKDSSEHRKFCVNMNVTQKFNLHLYYNRKHLTLHETTQFLAFSIALACHGNWEAFAFSLFRLRTRIATKMHLGIAAATSSHKSHESLSLIKKTYWHFFFISKFPNLHIHCTCENMNRFIMRNNSFFLAPHYFIISIYAKKLNSQHTSCLGGSGAIRWYNFL
ncbi:hypothetical protein ACJX0J_037684, partial [Zea mays]